jgi:polysaccharide biosynthesis/export protein
MRINSRFYSFIVSVALLIILVNMSSCGGSKRLRYFNDLPDSSHVFLPPMTKEERVIEYRDNLSITISAEEKEAVAFFNTQAAMPASVPSGGTSGSGPGSALAGYVVDPLGYIEFPIIGKIKVLGLTERQLKETLTQLIGKYVKNPLIDVRFMTFTITVLGDVGSPGTHILSTQRTTIFEALAAAGDLGPNGKRETVKLYRDYGGERTIMNVDLSKKALLYNPELFQMRHNDVLYVQPLRNQLFREDFAFATSMIGILAGFISLLYVLIKD